VRGIGHSAGATAFGALASGRPELVSRAMLIEPVIFDMSDPTVQRPSEMRERTLKRKRSFDNVEAMFANFEHKPPYKTWRREILRDYCERGTYIDADGKRTLKCHPEVEAEIYATSRTFDGSRTSCAATCRCWCCSANNRTRLACRSHHVSRGSIGAS
jgi:pimeloyl-ACP methyl ester carboxylesterase